MIHGDIKPENILVSHEGQLKLMDFGLSLTYSVPLREGNNLERDYARYALVAYDQATRTASCSTSHALEYRDPNVKTLAYSFEADVWAAAVVLMEMETGVLPRRVNKSMNLNCLLDTDFKFLIRQMLQAQKTRVTAAQVLVLL